MVLLDPQLISWDFGISEYPKITNQLILLQYNNHYCK